ncbi:hypothetical protein CspeluHIS016_0208230 [Cutaneotrichosporon spelunceum]|uniref:Chloride channel protein n=1 Tax=Cutaneotrichosporon spelunceum TaxID=1672016 RepID=A0AAD3TSL7_9TREE|nr:hypothetical protein CspeluHIS016_0208230 [Cutaneotrichosporon spelunceum]
MDRRGSASNPGSGLRGARPSSIASTRRGTAPATNHSRGQSSEEPSQPPSPMTYFPNPSTFTSEPPSSQYVPASIQTSPSLASVRELGSVSQSSLSLSSDYGYDADPASARTPRLNHTPGLGDLQSQQAMPIQNTYQSTSGALRGDSVPVLGASPRLSSSRRSASVASTRPTSTPTYGATSYLGPPMPGSLGVLGLGPESALGSALGLGSTDQRRIMSMAPGSSTGRRAESPKLPSLTLPSSGYTQSRPQPSTAHGTPRPRKEDNTVRSGSRERRSRSRTGAHRRGISVSSNLSPVHQDRSPSPTDSVFRKLKSVSSNLGLSLHRHSAYDDDSEYDEDGEDEGKIANGTRVWYSSYVTIDWLHDAIKESSRIRRVRHLRHQSVRGAIANAWDRFQGWLIVTVIGVLTALVAFLIIRSEMAFFDLKEGYCATSWGTAKRLCCAPRHGTHPGPTNGDEEDCADWVNWAQVFGGNDEAEVSFWAEPEFIAYFLVAVSIACMSSALTYYLTSSANHVTSKDSAFLGPAAETRNSQLVTPTKAPNEREPLLTPRASARSSEPPPQQARPVIYMAAGSGIPEIKTILSGFVIHGYLGMSTLVVKSVGLAMSVGSGLSLGKEGPFVHIASCIANIVSRAFAKYDHNELKRREILSAACAAGVAVSFGAPIGGVLFSLEEVSYYFPPKVMWRAFWCAAVAAIALRALNPYGNGSIVLFTVTYTKEYQYWEFAVFILLGVFGGLYGALFSRLNIIWSRDVRKGTWLGRHPILEVFLVTALTTFVSFLNPLARLGGTELVAKLFAECSVDSASSLCVDNGHKVGSIVSLVGGALLIRASLTIITFGVVLPAGIFIPSLVIGACFGRIVGVTLELFEFNHPNFPIFEACHAGAGPCIVPGIYAMVGAAATLAGVTRTTVSLAVIMFELTGTLNYVVPVMLAVLVAKTVADSLEKRGIYELVIELKKLPYLSNKEEYLWGGRLVSEVMDRDAPTLRADKTHTVRELTGRLLALVRLGYADAGFPVLVREPAADREGRTFPTLRILGFLGVNELEHALTELADEPDAQVNLIPEDGVMRSSRLSIFSFSESHEGRHNPYDLSQYIDRAPITVQAYSPLELVQQMFVKLGARQILVTDSRGTYRGALYKKQWIAFLDDLELLER